jgi:hypothetical protein
MTAAKAAPARGKRTPTGRMIDAGSVIMAAGSNMTANSKHRNRRETRQRTVEEFEKLDLPQPMKAIVLNCARAGMFLGQGKGRASLPQEEKDALETALR